MIQPGWFILCVLTGLLSASTYYVSSSAGNDAYSGLQPDSSWKTLDKVNTFTFRAGDSILFKCNESWRGQLLPQSGADGYPIVYSSFGQGEKPLLIGSRALNSQTDWIEKETNIWQSAQTFAYDIGNIIFNREEFCGVKKWSQSDLQAQSDFYYDPESQHLLIYSISNPAQYYAAIECALTRTIIWEEGVSFVTYKNLAVRYGGAHGIGGGTTAYITVRDCDFSWLGGGELFLNIRYGNGVEFWGSAHDNLVENCCFRQIYDAAMTNQNNNETVQQFNINYRYNQVWDCEQAFEFWCQPETSTMEHIYFENNTCVRAGNGWGHAQRPEPAGRHIMSYTNTAITNDIIIRNNILYKATESCLWISTEFNGVEALQMDYNCYYQPAGTMIYFTGSEYTMSEFSKYISDTGQDPHSLATDPLFVDASANDFHLQQDSPCIDAGDPSSPADADGTRNDMGALYFDQTVSELKNDTGNHPFIFHLGTAYPNPFNPITHIRFSLSRPAHVQVNIYTSTGRLVTKLLDSPRPAGNYQLSWDAKEYASSLYFIRMNVDGLIRTRKVLLVK